MFERGDIVRIPAALGFLGGAKGLVLVVQVPDLTRVLPTVAVVPLDPVPTQFDRQPWAVPVPAAETGAGDCAALVPQIRAIQTSKVVPGVAGRASPDTLARVDRVLRFTLGLR